MDSMKRRRLALLVGGGALLALAVTNGPVANVRVELSDRAMPRIEAALNLGLVDLALFYGPSEKPRALHPAQLLSWIKLR
jgi:hypothetical protein